MNFFGTDGIRGTYGSTLKDSTAFLLGKSLALLGDCPIVVIARDTRLSGDNLFTALAQGVYSGGGNVINLGILPTNSVGHFVRKMGGDYGVMITASHNPPCDNGLKVFDRYGVKLCESKQLVVSRMMDSLVNERAEVNKIYEPVFYDIENIYCDDMLKNVDVKLPFIKIALDCCYGASYRVAPLIFSKAGANVTAFCNQNIGAKVNVDCGATHTEYLLNKLKQGDYQLGFAFDGDADRLAVFEGAELVPNNRIFYAFAKYLHEKGKLLSNTVCGTVLTNGGVEHALNKLGIKLVRSSVGDTNVFNKMVEESLNFGGEESGHYLLCDYATSSDALVNALFVSKIYAEKGSLLKYTAECCDKPCATANIPITRANQRLTTNQSLTATVSRITALYPNCRVVLRKSGTENTVRAYLEGEQANEAMSAVVATFAQNLLPTDED
ncbi:MAG: hypothetical protein J1F65_05335 [Clostridiales bacterium]|nr:hypothetical protein [Clostridiales bacterium]